jgi:MFS family permease
MQRNWGGFVEEFKRDGGWRVVLASGIGFGMGMNVLPFYTLGAFIIPLERIFGWSRAQLQGSLVFLVLATLMGAWAIGWLTDRHGVRRVALGSQICLVVGLLLLAATPGKLWYWYAVWFFMCLTALGTSPITWTRAIAGWFDAGRGIALALALCGSGIAAILLPPAAVWLIEDWSWRVAYAALAALVLLIAIPATIWLLPTASQRPRSEASAHRAGLGDQAGLEVREAIRSYRFWVLLATTMLLGFAMSGMMPNLIPMLIDHGLTPAVAASFMGMMGGSLIVGRLLAGYALDYVWAPIVSAILFPMAASACILLAFGANDHLTVAVAVCLFGLATGAEFDLIPYIVTRYFGLKRYSQIYALQWVGWTVFGGLAPAAFGYVFDTTGSYRAILFVASGCFVASALLLLTLGRYPRTAPAQA